MVITICCWSSCPAWAAVGIPVGLSLLMVVYSSRGGAWRVLWASWAAWVLSSGVGSVHPLSWRCGCPGGPCGGPAAVAGIVAGRRVLGPAVDRGGADGGPGPLAVVMAVSCPAWRVRLLCMVPGLWPVLRSVCLGCWRRCMASSVAVIVAAGCPAAVGVLSPFGTLPQVHSRVTGVPGQVFAALTRRG